jgi:hypothetical protein
LQSENNSHGELAIETGEIGSESDAVPSSIFSFEKQISKSNATSGTMTSEKMQVAKTTGRSCKAREGSAIVLLVVLQLQCSAQA